MSPDESKGDSIQFSSQICHHGRSIKINQVDAAESAVGNGPVETPRNWKISDTSRTVSHRERPEHERQFNLRLFSTWRKRIYIDKGRFGVRFMSALPRRNYLQTKRKVGVAFALLGRGSFCEGYVIFAVEIIDASSNLSRLIWDDRKVNNWNFPE